MSPRPRTTVDGGGLMCYTFGWDDKEKRMAEMLDKLLRGANPATLPFEQPHQPIFAINRRTARALGIEIPRDILVRATQVID